MHILAKYNSERQYIRRSLLDGAGPFPVIEVSRGVPKAAQE